MLQYRTIPKQISLQCLNPGITPLQSDNTIIPRAPTFWLPSQARTTRLAVVNNFGAAGSNSALLLEKYLHFETLGIPFVFALSARTEQALQILCLRYIEWLRSPVSSTTHLVDIAYTMTARRQIHRHRIAVSAIDKTELIDRLYRAPSRQVATRPTHIAFVFSVPRHGTDAVSDLPHVSAHHRQMSFHLGRPGIFRNTPGRRCGEFWRGPSAHGRMQEFSKQPSLPSSTHLLN